MTRKRLTVSSSRCYRRCQREYRHRYIDGYRARDTAETLFVGTLIHQGLEQIWGCQPVAIATGNADADPYMIVKVEEMLRGYVARWGAPPALVPAIEAEFCAPLINPESGYPSQTWELAGKIDAVQEDEQGRYVLVEHKTSSEDITAGSDYWRRLRIDAQVSTYFVGGQSLGFNTNECLYDVLKKPGLKPYKSTPLENRKYKLNGALYANQRDADETPEEYRWRLREAIAADPESYYQRGVVVRLSDEERDAAHDLWQVAKGIRESELTNRWPRNPDACLHWGRPCMFFDVCTGCASLEDPMMFLKLTNTHPELAKKNHVTNEPCNCPTRTT
jgi:hypothetical protein